MADHISIFQDVIDSRDVIERIEELENMNENEMDETETRELEELTKLQKDAEPYCPDWQHGAQLIRDSYFKEYCQELAEDCGMIPKDLQWPCNHIDWEAAADDARQDYTEIDFGGVSYFTR